MFRLPENQFDGVEERGFLSYWEQVGALHLAGDLSLPVNVNFRSNRESTSPTLGKSWILLPFDSHVLPTSETSFLVVMPDGLIRPFWRSKDNPQIFRGPGGWVGRVNNATVEIWAECGWKIRYTDARIREIKTPSGSSLNFEYNRDLVVRVTEDGREIYSIAIDTLDTHKRSLILNSKEKYTITLDQKPAVGVVANHNVIRHIDYSLSSITNSSGEKTNYTFSVDTNRRPTLVIERAGRPQREFTWDPATRHIVSDGHWKYDIDSHQKPDQYAAIARINQRTNEREFWHRDPNAGTEVTIESNGLKKTVTRFSRGGVLAGKVRKVVVERGGQRSIMYSAAYDEDGDRARQEFNDGRELVMFDKGIWRGSVRDGNKIWTSNRDPLGHFLEEKHISGKSYRWTFRGDNIPEKLAVKYASGVSYEYFYDRFGRLAEIRGPAGVETIVRSASGEIVERRDPAGRSWKAVFLDLGGLLD